jgi:hypothetical protein
VFPTHLEVLSKTAPTDKACFQETCSKGYSQQLTKDINAELKKLRDEMRKRNEQNGKEVPRIPTTEIVPWYPIPKMADLNEM